MKKMTFINSKDSFNGNLKKILFATLTSTVFFWGARMLADDQPEPTFQISFEEGFKPEATGATEHIASGAVVLTQGKDGKGVSLKGSDQLKYSAKGNLSREQGTVMMLVKLTEPFVGRKSYDKLFFCGSEDGKNNLAIVFDQANPGIVYASFRIDGKDFYCYPDKKIKLKAGTWYHITMTWKKGKKLQLYINGILVGTGVRKVDGVYQSKCIVPDKIGEYFYIGSDNTKSRSVKGIIDDFYIFDGPLDALMIKDMVTYYNLGDTKK
jgi:hypothetical protein